MNLKTILLLTLITLLAFGLRFSNTATHPPLLWDEAALGYNAYSLLETGRDEYGRFLPLIFKSFGDYKPGFYIYLTIPFVALMGLTPLAVRLPSILIGSLTPLFLYLLVKQLSPKSTKTALLSALMVAITPFNIHFSRGAWETNILTAQIILTALFYFRYQQLAQTKWLFLSALTLAASLYTYQAGKMVGLLLVLILFVLNLKKILKPAQIKSHLGFFILPLLIASLPLLSGLLLGSDSNRLKVISLFSYPRSGQETETIISESNSTDFSLLHNHLVFFGRNVLSRYFNHFSPRFLIFEGDWQNTRHSTPYIGVLLYPSLIFLTIGLLFSFLPRQRRLSSVFFLLWLFAAPIPGALTRDSVQAVRTMSLSIPLAYFTATGLIHFFGFLKKSKLPLVYPASILAVTVLYLFSLTYYSELYHRHLTKKAPNEYLHGYQNAIEYLLANQDRYQHITFTDYYGQPYIYYLFFSRYSPVRYQLSANLLESSQGDTGKVQKIGNINFKTPDYNLSRETPGSLAIFSHEEIIRQGIDLSKLTPLSPVNGISTFYAYTN